VFCWKRKCPSSAFERADRLSKRNKTKFVFIKIKEEEECRLQCTPDVGREECVESVNECYANVKSEKKYCAVPLYSEFGCQTPAWPSLAIEHFRHDDAGVLFYTGLANYTDFKFALATLGDGAYNLNYLYNRVDQLNIENQFFFNTY